MDEQIFNIAVFHEDFEDSDDEDFLERSCWPNDDSSSSDDDIEIIAGILLKEKRWCIRDYYDNVVPAYTEKEFQTHFRVKRSLFKYLEEVLEQSATYKNLESRKAISAGKHMALFLWFAGHEACSFRDVGDRFDVCIGTVSKIIERVAVVISGLADSVIKWPSNDEKERSSKWFKEKSGFEGVIGAIDGTHVKIMPPKNARDDYINRKGDVTLQVQAISNYKKKFIDVFIGYPGSAHDNRVFQNSPIYNQLPSLCGQYYILGDSAYACTDHVIVPFRDNGHLSAKHKFFNRSLSSSRIVIEHAFGMLKQRFRQLYQCKLKGNEKLCHFIRACIVLHNLCDEDDLSNDMIFDDANEDADVPTCFVDKSNKRRNELFAKLQVAEKN